MQRRIYPQEGWEHIEAVIPMQQSENVDSWIERVIKMFALNENPKLNIKISQPEVEGEQLPNPTIAINVKNANADIDAICLIFLFIFFDL